MIKILKILYKNFRLTFELIIRALFFIILVPILLFVQLVRVTYNTRAPSWIHKIEDKISRLI